MQHPKRVYFRFSKPEPPNEDILWRSSQIKARNAGKWMIFTDANDVQLNSNMTKSPRHKKYYKYKGYQVPQECFDHSDSQPLNTEVSMNYSYFIPRRELVSTVHERERTQRYDDEEPKKDFRKGFVGKNPLTMPFRTSTKILNEKRFKELRRAPRKIQTVRSPRCTYLQSQDE
ncbi:hypothetical protein TVAG_128710 [Trichomonas vaginalis G3]|uniref:Uncharacterized protein n=1 Tax=Trichomonas vaginalis (strain ATCC PRA-98 / G3) TaxID=412133 RepID=A2E4C2_TRIV3|nr:hypothetical protein TVAGG3_0018320 [Trichomonas vaginalis G3]EAY12457.1 hypothetical protein TVAG_128710 [Trichomonas vaginalis G3]KAI5539517.1 hypothetical protein TVAGG3_0018320 [Trichomonas vaginalis G3]|eukprot:XP_001324680.1 hypothetical protein [Trichomonas vaginalis G3]